MVLIRFVFIHWLGSADLWFRWLRDHWLAAGGLLAFVDIFENIGNHRRGHSSAMDFAADFALIKRCERKLRLVGRKKSGEPCGRALLVLRSPLRRSGFSGDFNIVQTGFVSGAARPVDNLDQPVRNWSIVSGESSSVCFARTW